tara:strand:- start:49179 stop:50549 length:1371 start_codon:yes stop_codon:yes gene_type:complete
MYTQALFESETKVSRNDFFKSLKEVITQLQNTGVYHTYGKRLGKLEIADLARVLKDIRVENKSQKLLKDIILGTVFNNEKKNTGSGYVFLSCLLGLYKSIDLNIQPLDKTIIKKSFALNSRKATFKDYRHIIQNYYHDKFTYDILVNSIQESKNVGSVFVNDTPRNENIIEIKVGYDFPIKPPTEFIQYHALNKWKYHDVKIIVIEGLIERVSEIEKIFLELSKDNSPTIIIARGFAPEVCNTLAVNMKNGMLNILPLCVPYDLNGINMLNDIATVCGLDVRSSLKGELISTIKLDDFNHIKSAQYSRGIITIEHEDSMHSVNLHVSNLKEQLKQINERDKINLISQRIRNLTANKVEISISSKFGEMHGVIKDRIESGFNMFYHIRNYGVIDLENIELLDPKEKKHEYLLNVYINNSLKKLGLSLFGTTALMSGIDSAFSIYKQLKNSSVSVIES